MVAVARSPRTQARVVQRARAGCRRSFAALWEDHQGRVRSVVARVLPRAFVEDVVQDVAVAALAGIGAFRAEGDFAAWLLSIARNRALTAREGLRRQRARIGDGPRVEAVHAADASAADVFASREMHALLRRLPRTYRLPLWLRFVDGCSSAEIADRLGTTQGTVRVALCRGLRRLRDSVARPSPD